MQNIYSKASTSRIISAIICFMGLCSCCKVQHEQGSLQPEWSFAIPTYESEEIFYDGLPNLPKNKDIILAHTTVYDGGFQNEDNRLCAIDIKRGNVVWYFPSDLATRHFCRFDAKGYAYNDKFVFQYMKNGNGDSQYDTHTTVCLDARNGDILWELDGVFYLDSINKDVVGDGKDCFFVQGENKVCKADLSDNSMETIYDTDTLHISGIRLCDDYLVVSCFAPSKEEFKQHNYCVVLDKETADAITRPIYIGECDLCCHGLVEDGILYANQNRYITAIDIRNNTKLWERQDDWAYILVDMYVHKNVLLKCAVNATVGYDKKTGEILYDYQDYGSWYTSIHKGYAYLLNRKDILVVFDVLTGKMLDHVVCPVVGDGFFGSYPVVYDEKLYIIGGNSLYRYPTYPWK